MNFGVIRTNCASGSGAEPANTNEIFIVLMIN